MNPSPHYKVTSVSYNNTSNVKSDCFQLQEVFDGDQDWSLLLNYRRQMTFHQVSKWNWDYRKKMGISTARQKKDTKTK